MPKVLIICGSKSDEHIAKKATSVLDRAGISYVLEFASAHREPTRVQSIIEKTDADVIIAIAGLSAALPGFVASHSDLPVIGVPVSAALGGLDALLSIAQMPKGVPVATVGIDNGQNAAHLAIRILNLKKGSRKPIPKSYAEAGVDENAVMSGLKVLARYVKKSFEGHGVIQDFGHYANTVMIDEKTCIAMSTDGVGSKVMIADMMNKFSTIGIDCVAMNVNDLISIGATPVGFVDYLAVQYPLPENVMNEIGQGLLEGCQQANIPILGGETAVLPDMIKGVGNVGLDLAGTAVGVAKPDELIDGSQIQPGDIILGISSNGLHSNGFTLVRKVLLQSFKLDEVMFWGEKLGNELLRPTRIYVKHFKALKDSNISIKGIAHITGSGFKKLLRLGGHEFLIESFPEPPEIFTLIQNTGSISDFEMFSTFNMGIGIVFILSPDDKDEAIEILSQFDNVYKLGKIQSSERGRVSIKPYKVVFE